jgi:hypothetical protein
LVIGNAAYEHVDALTTPVRDAEEMKGALEELGFSVVMGTDLDRKTVEEKFALFEENLRGAVVGLLYYSGHGLQIEDTNYIVPIDADPEDESFAEHLVSLQDLISSVSERAETTLVFLDACRDNPLADGVNAQRERTAQAKGLPVPAPLATAPGLASFSNTDDAFSGSTFIAFAAAPGRVAWSGNSEVSIFTEGLLADIRTTDLAVSNLMMRVAHYVRAKTENQQEPWNLYSLKAPFFFNPGSLVWFTSNIIGFVALLVALGIHSTVIRDTKPGPWMIATVAIFILGGALGLFLFGLHRSFRFVRGDFAGDAEGVWARSFIGGFFGGLFSAPLIGIPYYLSLTDEMTAEWTAGKLLGEITIACAATGVTLGALSYAFFQRPFLWWRNDEKTPPVVSWISGTIGGGLAGIVPGAVATCSFGIYELPPAEPFALVFGGLLGVALLVLSILSYSVERFSYREFRAKAAASVIATLCVSAVIGIAALVFGYESLARTFALSLEKEDVWPLLFTGLWLGPVIGVVFGAAISLALVLDQRRTRKDRAAPARFT